MEALEKSLSDFFVGKLWAFPTGLKEFIVKVAPYLMILGVVLTIPAVLLVFGLGTLGLPLVMMSGGGVSAIGKMGLGTIFMIVVLVLDIMAIPGLFKRTSSGWRFAFYAALVGGVQSLLMMDLGGLIIGLGLSLYVLFQVKSYYR